MEFLGGNSSAGMVGGGTSIAGWSGSFSIQRSGAN